MGKQAQVHLRGIDAQGDDRVVHVHRGADFGGRRYANSTPGSRMYQRSSSMGSRVQGSRNRLREAQAQVAVAVAGVEPEAVGDPGVPGRVAPGAATGDPVGA